MRILEAKVEWMEAYANRPTIKLLVDKMPSRDDYRYEECDGTYYAESDGSVSFFYYKGPGRGYGGSKFLLKMKDGTERTLVGPWSSNSASVNEAGFGPCAEVSMTDDRIAFRRGYTFSAGAVTLEKMREACEMAGVHLVCHDGTWCPSLHPTKLIKPNGEDGYMEYGENGNGYVSKALSAEQFGSLVTHTVEVE